MGTSQFWELIENTWKKSGRNADRLKAIETNDETLLGKLSLFADTDLISYYKTELKKLEKDEFTSYIHLLEEKLFKIDRQEIHEYTDGSDDGFLYCRCFILSMGEEYYNRIDKNPARAKFDLEAESFGFEAYRSYGEKFSEEFTRNSIHCIETASNPAGW